MFNGGKYLTIVPSLSLPLDGADVLLANPHQGAQDEDLNNFYTHFDTRKQT